MEPTDIRLVHWYDTQGHRIACGAPGHLNSTKHARAVTCTECLEAARRATSGGNTTPPSYVN